MITAPMSTTPTRATPVPETFRRREVIQICKLDGRVLDFWEREFGAIHPLEYPDEEKHYTQKDIETIIKLKQWLLVERLNKEEVRLRLQQDHASAAKLTPHTNFVAEQEQDEVHTAAADADPLFYDQAQQPQSLPVKGARNKPQAASSLGKTKGNLNSALMHQIRKELQEILTILGKHDIT